MLAEPEVLGNGTIGGKKALGVSGGLEALHVSLPPVGGLVGVLRAIIQIPVLAMCYSGEDLSLGGSVALQLIGDEHPWKAITKDARQTNYIEHFNNTLRQRVSRLVRSTLAFSKKVENHIGAIRYFICHYNLTRAALPV